MAIKERYAKFEEQVAATYRLVAAVGDDANGKFSISKEEIVVAHGGDHGLFEVPVSLSLDEWPANPVDTTYYTQSMRRLGGVLANHAPQQPLSNP